MKKYLDFMNINKIILIFTLIAILIIITATQRPVYAIELAKADLKGTSVLPPVNKTHAYGTAEFIITRAGQDIKDVNYTINITGLNLTDVTSISINSGHDVKNGPPVYLFPNSNLSSKPAGLWATGKIIPERLQGPLGAKGKYSSLLLIDAISNKDVYVIVRTVQHPHGEIRGQIIPTS